MKIRVLLLVAALAACGSKKQEEPAATPPPVPTVVADAAAGSAELAAADDAGEPSEQGELDLPTAVDFEEQAESDITDKNVAAYVKSIEQELGE